MTYIQEIWKISAHQARPFVHTASFHRLHRNERSSSDAFKTDLNRTACQREQALTPKRYHTLLIYFKDSDFEEDSKKTAILEEVLRKDYRFDSQVHVITENRKSSARLALHSAIDNFVEHDELEHVLLFPLYRQWKNGEW